VPDNKKLKVSKCEIEIFPDEKVITGKPMSLKNEDRELNGKIKTFRVTSTDELNLVVGLITWPMNLQEVKPIDLLGGLEKHELLAHKGQMEIKNSNDGNWLVTLRTLKFNHDKRYYTLVNAPLQDLDDYLGFSFRAELEKYGVLRFGTRAFIDGEVGRSANQLAMVVEPENIDAIAVAYTVTRPLAVINDYGLGV
jgi:hypothetical protein